MPPILGAGGPALPALPRSRPSRDSCRHTGRGESRPLSFPRMFSDWTRCSPDDSRPGCSAVRCRSAPGALGLLDELRSRTDAIRVTRAAVFVVVAFAATTSLVAAGIRPAEEKLAERLTLQLSDFPSGWTADHPPSTRLEKVHCATAPKIEGAITGYSDSADFVPLHPDIDKRSAGSTTRVFSSVAAARAWYKWAGEGKSACDLNAALASWKRYGHGFKVSRPRHVRESSSDAARVRRRDAADSGDPARRQGQIVERRPTAARALSSLTRSEGSTGGSS
jgi:hypothetical protein